MTENPSESTNGRRPTIRHVAQRAGVSKSLVSLVLRDAPQVSKDKREAVLRAMGELGYQPNAAARSLGEQRTRAVGVLLNDLRNPWFVDLLDGLHSVLYAHGLHMLLGDGRMNRQTDESLIRMFTEMRVDGLVLVGMMPISAAVAEIAGRVPTVMTGSREVELPRVDTIANDDRRGGELAVQHLLDLGHTRIAHIAGWGAVGRLRQQAYEATMRTAGLQDHIRVEPGDLTEEGGYRATVRLLSRGQAPTAIFASNDMSCIGAQSAADELGIATPGELSLVGYDNTYLAQLRHLWLTSVDGANHEIGQRAGRTLLTRIEHPDRPATLQLVAPSLQIRTSTAPQPSTASPPTNPPMTA
ncbi:MAG TPA: LacI family DNA-binding transcriptional regulator [Mycobacteriales bacterium]|jgi:DNA-binding LacI/PurR family transcriptional regulator|nr:LacI family DNA-binding transcriptional regulator [Mycobacteriales bacterium]